MTYKDIIIPYDADVKWYCNLRKRLTSSEVSNSKEMEDVEQKINLMTESKPVVIV